MNLYKYIGDHNRNLDQRKWELTYDEKSLMNGSDGLHL